MSSKADNVALANPPFFLGHPVVIWKNNSRFWLNNSNLYWEANKGHEAVLAVSCILWLVGDMKKVGGIGPNKDTHVSMLKIGHTGGRLYWLY